MLRPESPTSSTYIRQRMLNLKYRVFLFVIGSLLGCNQRQVKIIDEHYRPLADAEITSLAPSSASPTAISDINGIAQVPGITGELVLRVVLAGYETAYINISYNIPAVVKLKKAASLSRPAQSIPIMPSALH